MFIILLKFSNNKSRAGEFISAHKTWVQRGLADGVFLLVGSLQPNMGGGILANKMNLDDLQNRIQEDPFVAEDVVTYEIIEITPHQADERLKFLLG